MGRSERGNNLNSSAFSPPHDQFEEPSDIKFVAQTNNVHFTLVHSIVFMDLVNPLQPPILPFFVTLETRNSKLFDLNFWKRGRARSRGFDAWMTHRGFLSN